MERSAEYRLLHCTAKGSSPTRRGSTSSRVSSSSIWSRTPPGTSPTGTWRRGRSPWRTRSVAGGRPPVDVRPPLRLFAPAAAPAQQAPRAPHRGSGSARTRCSSEMCDDYGAGSPQRASAARTGISPAFHEPTMGRRRPFMRRLVRPSSAAARPEKAPDWAGRQRMSCHW